MIAQLQHHYFAPDFLHYLHAPPSEDRRLFERHLLLCGSCYRGFVETMRHD